MELDGNSRSIYFCDSHPLGSYVLLNSSVGQNEGKIMNNSENSLFVDSTDRMLTACRNAAGVSKTKEPRGWHEAARQETGSASAA